MEIYPVDKIERNGIIFPAWTAPTKLSSPRHDELNIPKDEFKDELSLENLRLDVSWNSVEAIKVRAFGSAAPQVPHEWVAAVEKECFHYIVNDSHIFITPESGQALWHEDHRIIRMFPMRSYEVVMRFSKSLDTESHPSHYQRNSRQPEYLKTILDQEMTPHTRLRACFTIGDEIFTDYVDMETQPSVRITPATGLSPPEETSFYTRQEDTRHTHVYYCNDENRSEPYVEKLPLPYVRPKCPKQWDAGAWSNRTVAGISRFHVFIPGAFDRKEYHTFVLKVSDKSGNGSTVYEDMSPMSSQLLDEMEEFNARSCESMPKVLSEDIQGAEDVREGLDDGGPLVEVRDAVVAPKFMTVDAAHALFYGLPYA